MSVNWTKGVGFSVLASIVGGASKLAIRKSWTMVSTFSPPLVQQNDDIEDDELNQDSDTTVNNIDSLEIIVDSHNNCDNIDSMDESSQLNTTHGILNIDIPISKSKKSTNNTVALLLRLSGMIGMTFINPLFCVMAMNYASPSILAPFSGLTLVWIVLFSKTLIGEEPNTIQKVAAFFIILGEVIVALFGDHTNDEDMIIDDVIYSYGNIYFQLYFIFMFVLMLGIASIIRNPRESTLKRFAFGIAGGTITGLQNFLKDSLTIKKAADMNDESYPWFLYLFIILAIVSSFGGLLFLTACMKRYDATFSSAMFVGSFVISASIMSSLHYHTFENLYGFLNWVMYPTGLVLLIFGVHLLMISTQDNIVDDTELNAHSDSEASTTGMYPLMTDEVER